MASECLLDTDILSEILRGRNSTVVQHASQYLLDHGRFKFSAITRYEIRRGLLAKAAATQLLRFEAFCDRSDVLPISVEVLDRAAERWSEARSLGRVPSDPDLIIAATAELHQLRLVTGNSRHFEWIVGLSINDWRQPESRRDDL